MAYDLQITDIIFQRMTSKVPVFSGCLAYPKFFFNMTKSFDVITRLTFEIDETEYFELSKVWKHYVIK